MLTCAAVLLTGSVRVQGPAAVVSPRGDAAAFARMDSQRADPPPETRRRQLSGIAFGARNSAPWPAPDIDGITVVRLPNAVLHEVLAPFETTLGWIRFSPDGAYLSYAVIRDTGIEQWVLDIASGIPRPLTTAFLNATLGEPCGWLADSSGMLCRFLESARGSPPVDPDRETDTAHEAEVAYYLTSQLGTVQLATGRRTDVGAPGIVEHASATPGGELVVITLDGPFSPTAPALHGGRSIEIWSRDGEVVRQVTIPGL